MGSEKPFVTFLVVFSPEDQLQSLSMLVGRCSTNELLPTTFLFSLQYCMGESQL